MTFFRNNVNQQQIFFQFILQRRIIIAQQRPQTLSTPYIPNSTIKPQSITHHLKMIEFIYHRPSVLAEARIVPSGLKSIQVIGSECAWITTKQIPSFALQIRIVSSIEQLAIQFPWALYTAQNTPCWCPFNSLTHFPPCVKYITQHSLTLWNYRNCKDTHNSIIAGREQKFAWDWIPANIRDSRIELDGLNACAGLHIPNFCCSISCCKI